MTATSVNSANIWNVCNFENQAWKGIPNYHHSFSKGSKVKTIQVKVGSKKANKSYIKKYKRLRNRVHLQVGDNGSDTDYFNFSIEDYLWIKYLLYTILSNSKLKNDSRDLAFLSLSSEEKKKAKIYVDNEWGVNQWPYSIQKLIMKIQ